MAETAKKLAVKTEKSIPPVMRSNGWPNFESLRHEIDDVFDRFGFGSWRLPFAGPTFEMEADWPKDMTAGLSLAVDLVERDKNYEITAELPGMDEKNIEIKVANGTLTIRGEKKEERQEKDKDYYLSERRYGSFTRAFALPNNVDADKIEASFAKGVLTVVLPKAAEALKNEKKIAIKSS